MTYLQLRKCCECTKHFLKISPKLFEQCCKCGRTSPGKRIHRGRNLCFVVCYPVPCFGIRKKSLRRMETGEKDRNNKLSPATRFAHFVVDLIDKPVVWFRETIVEPNRPEYYWYHERIRRVPTIDECYEDDAVCQYEAEMQYRRDHQVDDQILNILKRRLERCQLDNPRDKSDCHELGMTYENSITNYFIKYGDLGIQNKAFTCYMKQKHRMAWERRHGPVGSGKKEKEEVFHKK